MPALVPLTLVVGDEELLASRAVSAVVRAAVAADPQVDVRDLDAGQLAPGDLVELLSPSLFSEARLLVLRAGQDLAKEVAAELVAHLADLPPEIRVVLVHAGGQKGKAQLATLAPLAGARVDVPKITKAAERRDLLRSELRAGGRPVDEDAVTALLDAVGTDLRELCMAAGQLLSDTDGPVTADTVARYHRGRADATGFAVADRAAEGDLAGALELLRWGRATGLAHVLVTSALASTLRAMAQVGDSGRSTSAYALAGALGMPAWKVEKTQRQVRAWLPDGLAAAVVAVAEADGAVKGGVVDQDYAVERALIAVVSARGAGR